MANGNFGGGNGTVTNPYLIEDGIDLYNINNFPTAYFKLARNINLGIYPFCIENGWNPIRNFSGVFDGNGKKILNLYINRPADDNVGLFANLINNNNGMLKIKNLFIENADIHAHINVGILAGTINNGQTSGSKNDVFVENCKITGKVTGYSYVGGVAGQVSQETNTSKDIYTKSSFIVTTMKNIYVNAEIHADNNNNYFGGVVGGWNNPYSFSDEPISIENILSVSTYDNKIQGQEDLSFSPCAFGYNDNNKQKLKCYFDNERWNSSTITSNTIGLTTEKLFKDNEAGFHNIVDNNANAIWTIRKENYPDLTSFNNKYILIKANDSYYRYHNNTWEKVFNYPPTINEAESTGMNSNDIRNIGLVEWNTFINEHTDETISVIDFENYSKGTDISELMNTAALINQDESNARSKNIFEANFNFDNLGSNIVYISKGDI